VSDEHSYIKVPPQLLWTVVGVGLTAAGFTTAGQLRTPPVEPKSSTRAIEQKIEKLSRSLEAGLQGLKHDMAMRDKDIETRLHALECVVDEAQTGCGLIRWKERKAAE